jgi:hypothetical protein
VTVVKMVTVLVVCACVHVAVRVTGGRQAFLPPGKSNRADKRKLNVFLQVLTTLTARPVGSGRKFLRENQTHKPLMSFLTEVLRLQKTRI